MAQDNEASPRDRAHAAMSRAAWDEALTHFSQARIDAPDDPEIANGVVGCLTALSRFDEARVEFDRAAAAHPQNYPLAVRGALIEACRGDVSAALPRWLDIVARFPDHAQPFLEGAALLNHLERTAEATSLLAEAARRFPDDVYVSTAQNAHLKKVADRTVLMEFQSIGENCEFGLLQRHFGAEPVSLLRWGSISISNLILALDTRFAGIGAEENTLVEATAGEYYSADVRYGMSAHTFIPPEEDYNKVFASTCARLTYLSQKIIEDLEDGSHIFVFQSPQRASLDLLPQLYSSIRRYGPSRLFFVILEDEDHPCGHIEVLQPDLLVGYMDRLSLQVQDDGSLAWDVSFAHWIELCRRALSHFAQTRQDGAVA